jgi:hypothetical protein
MGRLYKRFGFDAAKNCPICCKRCFQTIVVAVVVVVVVDNSIREYFGCYMKKAKIELAPDFESADIDMDWINPVCCKYREFAPTFEQLLIFLQGFPGEQTSVSVVEEHNDQLLGGKNIVAVVLGGKNIVAVVPVEKNKHKMMAKEKKRHLRHRWEEPSCSNPKDDYKPTNLCCFLMLAAKLADDKVYCWPESIRFVGKKPRNLPKESAKLCWKQTKGRG